MNITEFDIDGWEDLTLGMYCYNNEQSPGGANPMPYCLNYEVRFYFGPDYCSGWLDSGKPAFTSSSGDFELS